MTDEYIQEPAEVLAYTHIGDGWRRYDVADRAVSTRSMHSCEWCLKEIKIGSHAQFQKWMVIADGETHFGHLYLHTSCFEEMNELPLDEVMP